VIAVDDARSASSPPELVHAPRSERYLYTRPRWRTRGLAVIAHSRSSIDLDEIITTCSRAENTSDDVYERRPRAIVEYSCKQQRGRLVLCRFTGIR